MVHKTAFIAFLIFFSCSSPKEKMQKSAIQVLSTKISQDPKNINLLYERVDYNKSQNNLESVLFDLKEIVRLDSVNAINHCNLAEIYFELSKSKSADIKYPSLVRHHLERSIFLDDKNKEPYALMGELLLAYNKFEDAIKFFNLSLEIEYNQQKIHVFMGYAFKQLDQIDNAINCFRNAINIDPDFFEAHMQLGQTFHLLGDTIALTYYNNALSLKPSDEMVLYNKALFYQSILDWNNALEAYSELHKVSPFNTNGHYNLGFIHMELGLYDVATNNFSDAIYSNSEFYEAYYSRGNCFETLGNIAQAESDYKRAIDINPEYTYAREALENLRLMNKEYNK